MTKQTTPHQHKQQVLMSVLVQVPRHGWTEQSLARGVKSSALSAAEGETLFPRGIADVIGYLQETVNDRMLEKIAARRDFDELRMRDKITFAVRARLDFLSVYREAVSRLFTWSFMPGHVRDTSKYLWQAADAIWTAAGDTSTDYNRYTKRLMLMQVMKATLTHWLRDTSPDHAETWDFLSRRVETIVTMGKTIAAVKNFTSRSKKQT